MKIPPKKTKLPTARLATEEETEAQKQRWQDYWDKSMEETPYRLEEAAKFLSGIISITFAIFIEPDKWAFEGEVHKPLLLVAVFFWLSSLLITLLIIFPKQYRVDHNSPGDIKKTHNQIVKYKSRLLTISVSLFLTALVLTSITFLRLF